jgi:TolB protein
VFSTDLAAAIFTRSRVIVTAMRRALLTLLCAAVTPLALVACDSADDDEGATPLVVYEATTDRVTNIFTIDVASGETTQLTDAANFDGNPAWSPDRERIVFNSRSATSEKYDLYVMDADGGNRRRLTDTPDAGELSPRFSPDGERIAYVSQTNEGWSVWVMAADGTGAERVAGTYFFAEFPAWTLHGDELIFAAIEQAAESTTGGAANVYAAAGQNDGPHIFSVDLETREVRTRIRTAGIDVCPHITPDGKQLLYASTVTDDNAEHAIFVHDLDSNDTTGASDTRLTEPGARNDYPDPSPDGDLIVFTSLRDGNAEMYVMNADGSGQRRLTNTPDARENVPDW